MSEYRVLDGKKNEGFASLQLSSASKTKPLKDEIQINFKACSLNFRDLIIVKGGYPFPVVPDVVPCSDGVGIVTEVGEAVKNFKVGDRVSPNFNQDHFSGRLTEAAISTGLGGALDGCLRSYGNFRALSCVRVPKNLNNEEAATLPCAGLTAWNALHGSAETPLKQGQWVLVEGTGGVSVFGAQFALAAGCNVILTSSSNEKTKFAVEAITRGHPEYQSKLHTINYTEIKEWGVKAKELSGGRGIDHIIEVGGEKTFMQSIAAIAIGGSISIIGFIARSGESIGGSAVIGSILSKNVRVRGILVGSVAQFEEMVRCIETNDIHPVIDKEGTFEFKDAQKAYEYQWSQKHVGKVVVKVE